MRVSILSVFLSMLTVCMNAQSLSSIIGSIEQNNLQLSAARDSNKAAVIDANADNSLLGETSAEYSPFYRKGINGIESSELIVSQEVAFPAAYLANKRNNQAKQRVFELEYQKLRRDILLQAECLCYDYSFACQMTQLYSHRAVVADSLLMAITKRFNHGDATLLDINRIRMDQMSIGTELAQYSGLSHSIELQLCALNGGNSFSESELSFLVPQDMQLTAAPLHNTSDLKHDSSASSIDVNLASAQVAEAKTETSAALRQLFPNLTIGYRRNTELKEASNGFLIGISMPLASNGKRIKAARLRQSAVEDEAQSARVEAEYTIAALQHEVSRIDNSIQTYDLSLMQQTLTLLRHAVMSGQISIIEYYSETEAIYTKLLELYSLCNQRNKSAATLRTY